MRLATLLLTSFLAILILMQLIAIPANTSVIHTTSPRITRIYVDKCMDIVESGYYELVADVAGTQTNRDYCIRISANNVVLDGKGYRLRSSGYYREVGVVISKASNVTIRNLAISRYAFGIVVSNSSNIIIANNAVDGFLDGVRVLYSELINITNNTIVNNRNDWENNIGIYVERSRTGYIEHNTVINNGHGCCGIMLNSSTLIIINRNNLINRGDYYYFDGVALINSDSNKVLNNFVVNCSGYSSRGGYNILGAGINLVNSHKNMVAGNSIERSRFDMYGKYGIRIDRSSENSIEYNRVSSYQHGISLTNSGNSVISFNTIIENSYGIWITRSNNNILFSNHVINNSVRGIYIEESADNTIYNNYLSNSVNAEIISALFNRWSIELQQGTNIVSGQWVGGNAWLKPDGKGYSQICVDELEPIGICDEPYYITKDNVDYYPLSIKPTTTTPTTTPRLTYTIETPRPTLTTTPTTTHIETIITYYTTELTTATPTPYRTQVQVSPTPTTITTISVTPTTTTPTVFQTATPTTPPYIDIDVEVDGIDYVLVNETASVPVTIYNRGGLSSEVVLNVKNMHGFLGIAYPLGNLTIRVPPYQPQVVNVMLRGIREGEEILVVSVYNPKTGDSIERSLKIPVTSLKTVYVNVFAGFYLPLPPIEFYRRPISSEIMLCGVRASYISGNTYVVNVPKIYRTCIVKVRDPTVITFASYEEVISIDDSIDVIIPDTYASLTLLAISWILLAPLYLSIKQAFSYTETNAIRFFMAINIVAVVTTLIKPNLFPGFYTTLVEMLTIVVAGTKLVAIKIDQYRYRKKYSNPKTFQKLSSPGWQLEVEYINKNYFGERYEIMDRIGEGGFSVVYKAQDIKNNKIVAIKIYKAKDEKAQRSFIEEIGNFSLLVKRLGNVPYIVKPLDHGISPTPFIVMDYYPMTLRDVISDSNIELKKKLRLMYRVAKALSYAHSLGVVHGDLKPENILVSREGDEYYPAISDWGGGFTPCYVAPEVVHSDGKNLTDKSDVYSFGIILYEVVKGERLFKDALVYESYIRKGVEITIDVRPRELEELIRACLARDPIARPTIKEVEKKLAEYLVNVLGTHISRTPSVKDHVELISLYIDSGEIDEARKRIEIAREHDLVPKETLIALGGIADCIELIGKYKERGTVTTRELEELKLKYLNILQYLDEELVKKIREDQFNIEPYFKLDTLSSEQLEGLRLSILRIRDLIIAHYFK